MRGFKWSFLLPPTRFRQKKYPFILALSVALYFLVSNVLLLHDPSMFYLGADDHGYISTAMSVVNKGAFLFSEDTKPSVFVMPGYPLWIALFYRILGVHGFVLDIVRQTQMAMSSGTALIIYAMTKPRFSSAVALAAFEGALFLPDFLLTPLFMFTESMFILLSTGTFFAALLFYERPGWKRLICFALLLGLSLLIRPTITLFPVAFLIWMLIKRRLDWKRFLQFSVAGALICSALLSPWWIRNYRVYQHFIPFTSATGSPFLIGTFPIKYNIDFPINNPADVELTTHEETLMHIVRRGSWYDWNQEELKEGYKNLANEWRKNPGQVIESYTIGKFLTFYGYMTWIPNYPIPDFVQSIIHWFIMLGSAIGMISLRRNHFAHVFYLYASSTQVVYQVFLSIPRYALPIDILMLPFASFVMLQMWFRRSKHSTYSETLVGRWDYPQV